MLTVLFWMAVIVAFFFLAVWIIYIAGFIIAALLTIIITISQSIRQSKRRKQQRRKINKLNNLGGK